MTRLLVYILENEETIVVGWNAISHKIIWAERVIIEEVYDAGYLNFSALLELH